MVSHDEFFHVHLEFQVDITKTFCLKKITFPIQRRNSQRSSQSVRDRWSQFDSVKIPVQSFYFAQSLHFLFPFCAVYAVYLLAGLFVVLLHFFCLAPHCKIPASWSTKTAQTRKMLGCLSSWVPLHHLCRQLVVRHPSYSMISLSFTESGDVRKFISCRSCIPHFASKPTKISVLLLTGHKDRIDRTK
jgi:hypothetical protein